MPHIGNRISKLFAGVTVMNSEMALANIQSVVDSLLECSICLQVYQDPRLLPCGHTFCLKCLQKLVNVRKDNLNQLPCSLCRNPWIVPADGLCNFPKNFIATDFITSLSSTNQCGETGENEQHDKAEYFCLDCWEPLCYICCSFHKRTKATRNHTIKKISDVSRDDISQHKKQIISKCLAHKDQTISLYCTECKDVACTVCFAVSHTKHDCIDIYDADKTFVDQINSSLNSLKASYELYDIELKTIDKYMQAFIKQNRDMEIDIKQLFSALKTNIKLLFVNLAKKINKYEESILESVAAQNASEINELENKRQKIAELLNNVNENISTKEMLLTSSSTATERSNYIKLKVILQVSHY